MTKSDNSVQRYLGMTDFFWGLVFIFLISIIAHFLFSRLGFSPTDDGFVLAGSKRILNGQVPHRDFISIRPAGSFFMHALFVLFGGDYTFWISRYFVWFQFACIAWAWTVIISYSLKTFRYMAERFAFASVAFFFSAHYFPIMAWHSIDALFMASIGILLCYRQSKSNITKMIGFLFIGISPLFRQNFLLLIPASVIIFNYWRQKRYWLIAGLPVAFYVGYLAINNAVPDAILQLTTHTHKELFRMGVEKYILSSGTWWGILVGYLATYMTSGKFGLRRMASNTDLLRVIGVLMLFGIPLSAAGFLAIMGQSYIQHTFFAIFGAVLGAIIYFIYKQQKVTLSIQCGALMLITAWSISLSGGYNTPALAVGPLVLFLIACGKFSCQLLERKKSLCKSKSLGILRYFSQSRIQTYINILTVLLVIGAGLAFSWARKNHIYQDMSASHLTHDLGEVLAGGKLIKINPNTYSFLKDLQVAKNITKKKAKEYCIIPDGPANWVKDPQSNPLSIDRPTNVELGGQADRLARELETRRGRLIVIVHKYEAGMLGSGFTPLSNEYVIVQYVRSNFNKIRETQFFELYE